MKGTERMIKAEGTSLDTPDWRYKCLVAVVHVFRDVWGWERSAGGN